MCLAYATDRRSDVIIGKLDPYMLYCIIEWLNLCVEEVAMIGDRIYRCKNGTECKSPSILTLSRKTMMDAVRQFVEKSTLIAQDQSEVEKWFSMMHQ